MHIEILEEIEINHSQQWVLVRGNINKPLLVQIQAGPGLPIISEANYLNKHFNWENEYLVVYWDLRGCGKSYRKNTDAKYIHLNQYADDVIACVEYLLSKYRKSRAILLGYSIGASIALMAATKCSSIFRQLFMVGIDINLPLANTYAINHAMQKINHNPRHKFFKSITELKEMGVRDARSFQNRAKILADLGGIRTGHSFLDLIIIQLKNLWTSKYYSITELIKTLQGINFCQQALLSELNSFNLSEMDMYTDVPLHFIQGKQDAIAPWEIAQEYFKSFKSSSKTFTLFEHSAHMPHLEEPMLFLRTLTQLSAQP